MKIEIEKYKSSFPVQTEYVKNPEGCGKTIFKQLKREGNVCLYSRFHIKRNKIDGYEAVVLRLVKAGTKLRGGKIAESDYESYPNSGTFGRLGYFCTTLEKAESLYNEFLEKQKNKALELENDENEEEETYDIPPNNFTRVEFATFNCLPPANATNILKEMENDGLIKRVGLKKSSHNNFGKPSVLYSKV